MGAQPTDTGSRIEVGVRRRSFAQLWKHKDRTASVEYGDNYGAQVVAGQEAVKWLAGALVGAGLTLGIGTQAAKVADLEGFELWSIVVVALGFGAVAVGIWFAFRVLTPGSPNRSEISIAEAMRLRVRLLHHNALAEIVSWSELPVEKSVAKSAVDACGRFRTARGGDTQDDVKRTLGFLDSVTETVIGFASTATDKDEPNQKAITRWRDELVSAVDQLNGFALHKEVARRLRSARIAMAIAVIVAGACLSLLLLFAALADKNAEAVLKTPFGAQATLSSEQVSTLQGQLAQDAAHCALPPAGKAIDVTVVGGTAAHPVVQIAEPGLCAGTLNLDDPVAATTATTTAPSPLPINGMPGFVDLGQQDAEALAEMRGGTAGDNARCFPEPGVPVPGRLMAGTVERPTKIVVDGSTEGAVSCGPIFLEAHPPTKVFPG